MAEHIFFHESFSTPTGRMLLITDAQGAVRAADWFDKEQRMLMLLQRYHRKAAFRLQEITSPTSARRALEAYFDGEFSAIDRLPVATSGTDFQQKVWRALREIPLGEVISYGALATRIGHSNASRAVGLANGSNPVSIIVPCHRVIGANASLTGYGGGLERKRWLLAHEGVALASSTSQPVQLAMAIDS